MRTRLSLPPLRWYEQSCAPSETQAVFNPDRAVSLCLSRRNTYSSSSKLFTGYIRPALTASVMTVESRVCHPFPVARKASSVSASSRILRRALFVEATLPTGRPRRKWIIAGVCTRACSPRFACAIDSSRSFSKYVSSGSRLTAIVSLN